MIINRVWLKQFGPYAEETEWKPQSGITGIIAEVEDNTLRSNGVGKSHLVMSIVYAIYGVGEFGKIEELVYDKADPIDFYTGIEFIKSDGRVYSILRGRKKTSPYLIVKENEKLVGNEQTTITQKQKLIDEIIGMDYDMFTATVFFEQKKADKFINTGSAQSTEYLDRCLKLTEFREVIKETASDITTTKKALDTLSDDLKTAKTALEIETKKHDSITCSPELEKELESEKKTLNKYILLAESELASVANISELQERKKSLADSRSTKSDRLETASTTIVTTQKSITENTELLERLELDIKNHNSPNFEATLQKNNETIEEIKSVISELSETLSLVEKDVELQRKLQLDTKSEVAVLISNKDILETSLKTLQAGECVACHQLVSEEHVKLENGKVQNQIVDIQSKIKLKSDELVVIETEIADLLSKSESIKSDIANHNNTISDLEKDNTKCKSAEDAAKAQFQSLKTEKDSCQKLITSLQERLDSENELMQTYSNDIQLLDTEISSIELELEKYKSIDVSILKSSLQTATDRLTAVEASLKNLMRLEAEKKVAFENVQKCGDEVVRIESEYNNTSKLLQLLNITLNIYKSMIESIFSDSIKLIEYHSNIFLQKIYPQFAISIYRDTESKREPLVYKIICDGLPRSYKRLSGGQKTIVDISLRLGFSKTLIDRSQVKIDFVCLDEPFESLDEYNREEVKKILIGLRDTFKQVFIISHTPDAKDCENMVKIVMNKKGQSRLISA